MMSWRRSAFSRPWRNTGRFKCRSRKHSGRSGLACSSIDSAYRGRSTANNRVDRATVGENRPSTALLLIRGLLSVRWDRSQIREDRAKIAIRHLSVGAWHGFVDGRTVWPFVLADGRQELLLVPVADSNRGDVRRS